MPLQQRPRVNRASRPTILDFFLAACVLRHCGLIAWDGEKVKNVRAFDVRRPDAQSGTAT